MKMIAIEDKYYIKRCLKKFKRFKKSGYDNTSGLCAVTNLKSLSIDIRTKMFRSWPYFSGVMSYPVPSGDKEISAVEMYDKSLSREQMYGANEYGKLRRDLAEHCIKFLTKLIEESNE